MAASDAKPIPIYGVAHRESGVIYNVTTGEVITGGLAGLTVTGSLDGAGFASTGLTVTEIGTTGYFTVDIDVTRMTCNTLILKVVSSSSNSSDWTCVIYPSLYYLPATDSTNKAVILQSGTGTGQVDLSSGQVKVQNGTSSGQISATSGKVKLAADGLDTIAVTEVAAGSLTTFPQWIMWGMKSLRNKKTSTGKNGTMTIYGDDGSTILGVSVDTNDGVTQTVGKFS